MRLLLDTHVLLWALLEPDRLPREVHQSLLRPATVVLVSAASAWEIATKDRLGKLAGAQAVVSNYYQHLETFLASELPITSAHALRAGGFRQSHKDPFDRLLAAQSLLEDIPLVTRDPAFAEFPIQTLWD